MRKLTIALWLSGILLAVACSPAYVETPAEVPEKQEVVEPKTIEQEDVGDYATPEYDYVTEDGSERPEGTIVRHNIATFTETGFNYEVSGINPGKVIVGDPEPRYRSGIIVEIPLEIYNASDEIATFSVAYADPNPNNMYEGFVVPESRVREWVVIEYPEIEVAPKKIGTTLVWLKVPEGEMVAPKWEFRVVVKQVGQVGQVQVAWSERWLIYQEK